MMHEGLLPAYPNDGEETVLAVLGKIVGDALTDMVTYWDSSLICRLANRAYCDWLGQPEEKILGCKLETLLGLDIWKAHEAYVMAALRGEPQRFELTLTRPIGSVHHIAAQLIPDRRLGAVRGFFGVASDVTERREAQVSLQEAQERLRFALDAASIGDWNMDLRTNTSVRSPQHDRCFGHIDPVADWGYHTFLAHVHPLDRERVDATYKAALAGAGDYDVEFRVLWPDETLHWLWSRGRFYFDESGKPYRVAGIQADITKRRMDEETRREDAARLQLATEASHTGLWDWDLRNNVTYYSPIWKRQLGYQEHEIQSTQRAWRDLLHPEDADRAIETLHEFLMAPGHRYENEFRLRHKDGSYRWIVARAASICDESGRPVRMIGAHLDLTASKLAKEALIASENRFRSVIEASPVPYALNDDDHNITFLNPAFVGTFGYTLADIPTLADWWRLAYPDAEYSEWITVTWRQRLEAARRTARPFEPIDVTVRCKDGSSRRVVAQAASIEGSLTWTHMVILNDVTESRRLEQRIIEAATHEQHRLGLDLHDGLGQELTGLSMMLIALSRRVAALGDAPIERELATMAGLASRCVRTARSIAHGLSPVELAGTGLADALCRLVRSTMTITNAHITLNLVGLEDHAVSRGMTEAVYRIVQEAIANALKHGAASQILVDAILTVDSLSLTVTDNGRGLPAAGSADGMGISIMRYRARTLGGTLTVENLPSGGTLVACTCPLPFLNVAMQTAVSPHPV